MGITLPRTSLAANQPTLTVAFVGATASVAATPVVQSPAVAGVFAGSLGASTLSYVWRPKIQASHLC